MLELETPAVSTFSSQHWHFPWMMCPGYLLWRGMIQICSQAGRGRRLVQISGGRSTQRMYWLYHAMMNRHCFSFWMAKTVCSNGGVITFWTENSFIYICVVCFGWSHGDLLYTGSTWLRDAVCCLSKCVCVCNVVSCQNTYYTYQKEGLPGTMRVLVFGGSSLRALSWAREQ